MSKLTDIEITAIVMEIHEGKHFLWSLEESRAVVDAAYERCIKDVREEQELLNSHPEFVFYSSKEIAACKRGEDSVWKLFEDAYPELASSLKKSM